MQAARPAVDDQRDTYPDGRSRTRTGNQPTGLPHWLQNLAPAGTAPLHFPHEAGTSDVAHWLQNRAPWAFIALHCGQATPPLACGVGALRPQPWSS